MNLYWSPSLAGFCHAGVIDELPSDAVALSEAHYQALLDGQTQGQRIVSAADGQPRLQDPPAPSQDQRAAAERSWRDKRLVGTDYLVVRHRDELEAARATSLTDAQYRELQAYRLDLRDWPRASGFPDQHSRPVAPEWLASLFSNSDL
ncbi:phage tail assembly chaperone [Pseudomonas oryzihabitans]|uniref:phage tail assembly chaperone n=1 Tax=Pseudomonas oryzihabitans TaxID=47885 RepID=UPI00112476BD|nr:phage tail assembly chaperone [Pseudomonas psychrotolerans]QDD91317.1 hypothetical protein CCZ28_20790 [Pseudomonas psychrotolerans]